jgi:hypothetical protein
MCLPRKISCPTNVTAAPAVKQIDQVAGSDGRLKPLAPFTDSFL